MNHLFQRLTARAMGTLPLVQPRIAPIFDPAPGPGLATPGGAPWADAWPQTPAPGSPPELRSTPSPELSVSRFPPATSTAESPGSVSASDLSHPGTPSPSFPGAKPIDVSQGGVVGTPPETADVRSGIEVTGTIAKANVIPDGLAADSEALPRPAPPRPAPAFEGHSQRSPQAPVPESRIPPQPDRTNGTNPTDGTPRIREAQGLQADYRATISPVSPRLDRGPTPAPRSARPASVQVTIGRLEIRAQVAVPASPVPAPPARGPRISLAEHLRAKRPLA